VIGRRTGRRLSLRAELVFFQIFVLGGLLVASPTVYFYLSWALRRNLDSHLDYLATNLSRQLRVPAPQSSGAPTPPAYCEIGKAPPASDSGVTESPVHAPRHLIVTDENGVVLCSDGERQPLSTLALAQARERMTPVYSDGQVTGEMLRLVSWPFRDQSGRLRIMEVGVSKLVFEQALRGHVAVLVVLNLSAVALLVLGSHYILTRRAFAPLGRIVRRVEQIDEAKLGDRIQEEQGSDELSRLTVVLNRMLERLERAFQAESRFSSDVSHEIRSPLTALRGEIEVALRKERTPAEYQRVLRENLEEVLRLTRIAENLMSLAQADAGVLEMGREHIDLKELLVGVLRRLGPQADNKDIALELDAPEAISVFGDRVWLERLVENLVDNAILHSPHIATVGVSLRRGPATVVVAVADSGEGIPPEHLPHIFERFYRVDRSRSRSQGGAGLGLAIAQQIAILHGGRIRVESRIHHGSTFFVDLPSAPHREGLKPKGK
jgi:heavy metal sensor kinase